MFLVNVIPALVLFDFGASILFMSLVFYKIFVIALGVIDHPLVVEIVYDHTANASSVYRDCVLEIFSVKFPIKLIHILQRETRVSVGMDWLSRFGNVTNWEH